MTKTKVRPMPKGMKRVAIIDGDVLCYRIAISAQTTVNWATEGQPDVWTTWFKADETQARFRAFVEDIKEKTGADYAILCLTDKENWRHDILPSYKGNRKLNLRPAALNFLREHAQEGWAAYLKPRLEGDDCMGILATLPGAFPQGVERIIITIDKDLKTIPGKHYHIDKPELGIWEVTPEEAHFWHMYQTLTGDVTDGYAGCPGMGPVKAAKVLREGIAYRKTEKTMTRGPRKGEAVEYWKEVPAQSMWHSVVTSYEAAGQTEFMAITQARVARILHAEDYQGGKVIPWCPTPLAAI